MEYSLYIADTETSGLDSHHHDVIELSLYRMSDDQQKTWCIKPTNINNIDVGALRINGHKIEDLKHETKFGRDTYLDPKKVIIEIENWIMEDDVPTSNRVLCGHNISFDKAMLEQLWIKCDAKDTMPFGRRILDTMQIEFMMDWCKGTMAEGYSLSNLNKKYGIVNSKAHTAAADVLATKQVFEKQVELLKKILNKE